MYKQELLNKADELIKKANELKELASKEEDIILVPDEIKISKVYGFLGIFNGQHILHFNKTFGSWVVGNGIGDELIKCKLTPCEYEELKPGDVFYIDNNKDTDFKDLIGYAIKLNDGSYQYWENKDCLNYNSKWNYYWKVEPINS